MVTRTMQRGYNIQRFRQQRGNNHHHTRRRNKNKRERTINYIAIMIPVRMRTLTMIPGLENRTSLHMQMGQR